MNFALFLFCASSAAQLLSPAFAAGDTRSASLLKGTRGGFTSSLARRTDVRAKDEETDGSEPPKHPSSTTKAIKEVDAADEPKKGMGPPHKKGPPGHRDCKPCKLLELIVSSLAYSLSL